MAYIKPKSSAGVALGRIWKQWEFATLEWVAWFNHRRLLAPIGNVPPAAAEATYYRQLGESAKAA